jgi:hypothetical protein
MNPSILLKIGAVVLLLYATGHTLGAVILYKPHAPEEAAVIDSMKNYHVPMKSGSNRTLWDFYYGFGLAVGLLNYVFAALAWVVAVQAAKNFPGVGPLALVLAGACLCQTWLCWRYFFAIPLVMSLVAGLIFVAAWFAVTPAKG